MKIQSGLIPGYSGGREKWKLPEPKKTPSPSTRAWYVKRGYRRKNKGKRKKRESENQPSPTRTRKERKKKGEEIFRPTDERKRKSGNATR